MAHPPSYLRVRGWPYPEDDGATEQPELVDPRAEPDDDLVALHCLPRRVVADLTPAERAVIAGRFGFDGQPPRTLTQLHDQLHMSRYQTRHALDTALAKIRPYLTA
jgi:DNA-directed RNA polymerase sigma subunit (sigma70/sigma32)